MGERCVNHKFSLQLRSKPSIIVCKAILAFSLYHLFSLLALVSLLVLLSLTVPPNQATLTMVFCSHLHPPPIRWVIVVICGESCSKDSRRITT